MTCETSKRNTINRYLDAWVVSGTIDQWRDVNQLNEVMGVSGTLKEVTKMDSPVPMEVYSPTFFQKNPTPSNPFMRMSPVLHIAIELGTNSVYVCLAFK